MSQPDLINAGLYDEKPRSNIYTALLGVAFLSLCVATMLLSMEMKVYDNDFKAEKAKSVTVPTVAPKIEVAEAEPDAEATPEGTPTATPTATPSATSADPDGGTPTATPSATAAPATPSATAPAATPPAAPAMPATPAGTGAAPATPAASGTAAAPAATAS